MFTQFIPGLPIEQDPILSEPPPDSLQGQVIQLQGQVRALAAAHMDLMAAMAQAFDLLNREGFLRISDATIDASPIGTTTTSTGAFSTLNVGADGAISHLKAGTYTPTGGGVANIGALTLYEAQYLRVGNTVVVSGRIDADPIAAATTQLFLSLPIASNLGAIEDLAGTAASPAVAGQSAAIYADTANDRAQMEWVAVDLANRAMYYIYAYQVI